MEKGTLTIVPTPIGNLGDITYRAVQALEECDAIFAEDTRVTSKLLSHLGVKKPIHRMDENMISAHPEALLDMLSAGKRIAYCSDAGMPGVSDPGLRLIALARESGFDVEVLPGASAATTAYVASGFTDPSFYFGGFFPRKKKAQLNLLEKLSDLDAILIFYESPNRLVASLESIADVFPNRSVCVCRELTKLHEEVVSGTASNLYKMFEDREITSSIKGEIVLLIDAPTNASSADEPDEAAILQVAQQLLEQGLKSKEVSAQVSAEFDIPKKEAYDLVLKAKESASHAQ